MFEIAGFVLVIGVLVAAYVQLYLKFDRTSEALERVGRLHDAVVEHHFHHLFILSPDGRILRVSDSLDFLRQGKTGAEHSARHLVGKMVWETPWSAKHKHAQSEWEAHLREAALTAAGVPLFFRSVGQLGSGGRRVANVSLRAVKDPLGKLEYFVLNAKDVTHRERARRNLKASHEALELQSQLLMTTLNSTTLGIVMADAGGNILTYNRRFYELLELDPEWLERSPNTLDVLRLQIQRGDFGEHGVQVSQDARAFINTEGQVPPPSTYTRTTRHGRVLEINTQPLLEGGFVRTFADKTEDVQLANELRRALNLVKGMQAIAGVGGWEIDLTTGDVHWTDEIYRLLGVAQTDAQPSIAQTLTLMAPASCIARDANGDPIGLSAGYEEAMEITRADGEKRWIHTKSEIRQQDGLDTGYAAVLHDITAQKAAEQAIRDKDALWRLALDSVGDGVWEWNFETNSAVISENGLRMYGYVPGEKAPFQTQEWNEIIHPDDVARTEQDRKDHFEGRVPTYHNERRIRTKDGHYKWILSRGMVIQRTPDGKPLRMIGTHTDITERKRTEELIWQHANFDPLTGLPNRRMLRDRLEQEIKKCQRDKTRLAVMFIDLDHFKVINDSLGHSEGDELLVEAARRLKACVRDTDTVARMGGDEFTVVVTGVTETTDLERIVQCILKELERPFGLRGEEVYVSGSVGITVFPDDANDIEELFRHADQALYQAKDNGRNRFSFFTQELQEVAQQRARLSADLRMAVAHEQFFIEYQPIVELATGQVCKAEALIRWMHPTKGRVNPADFIPLAESTGLIVPMGDWIFKRAVEQIKVWRDIYHPDFQISINKSPVQFQQKNAGVSNWTEHLTQQGLPGNCVSLEITEGLLLNKSTAVHAQLQLYRDAGVNLSLDDFGTGYSSLSYLQNYEIHFIKIDQSFVKRLKPDSKDLGICRAIITMAHELGLRVVAEGVETAEQRELLRRAHCDFGQGYLFSKPLPVDAFTQYLNEQRRLN